MRSMALAVMIAVDVGLFAGIASSVQPPPPLDSVPAAPPDLEIAAPPSSDDPETSADEIAVGGRMFGTSDVRAESRPAAPPVPGLPLKAAPALKLVGVFVADGGAKRSIIVLIKHGIPPVVTRLKIGDVVEGWTLVDATRTTAKLATPDGSEQTIRL